MALIHAALDEPDLALDWLERAFAERTPELLRLLTDPKLDALRGRPRFVALLAELGYPGRDSG